MSMGWVYYTLPKLITQDFWVQMYVYDTKKRFFCMNKNQEKNKTECMGSDKGRQHPNISDSVLQKLNHFYKPFSQELFKFIKQKPFWKF